MTNDQVLDKVSTSSSPSDLRITDLKVAVVGTDGFGYGWPLIKIETNQGIVGIGEVRDGASANYALMLKSRLIGENPCDIDRLFAKIKQFGGHGRLGGGVCGIEIALCDLAGKAFGVPAYMFAGGKYRDNVKVYADTPFKRDPEEMGKALLGRMDDGFEFLKMDIGLWIAAEYEGGVVNKSLIKTSMNTMHPFTGIQVTDYGIEKMGEFVATVRDTIGYEIPLASDHFGHMNVESAIRIGKALDKYTLAWYEDMIPWQFVDQWARLKAAVDTPVCTGEDIYAKEGFAPLIEARAISVAHPDLGTSGGILETKRIADMARDAGIGIALHQAGTPVMAMANAQCAMAIDNFIALEMHSVDSPWWNDLVTIAGQDGPMIQNGYVNVPDAPGLGIELNEEAILEHQNQSSPRYAAKPQEVWGSTSEWTEVDSHDRTWS